MADQPRAELGRADWLWEDDLQMHVPCCTVRRTAIRGVLTIPVGKCGNGPLTGGQIETGDCGEH